MAKYTGSALWATFKAGTISLTQRALEVKEKLDSVDVTSGADTDKSYLLTLREASMKFSYLDDGGAAGSAVRALLRAGAEGTLVYGPEGSAAGKPKYSCVVQITALDTGFEYNKEVEREVSMQKSGAWLAHFELLGTVFP